MKADNETGPIEDVLDALDHAMPQWHVREQRQRTEPVPRRDDNRHDRRKSNRWKW